MISNYEQLKQELVIEFGLDVLAPEKQEEMIEGMMEVLMKRIFIDTMEKLGEDGMNEYETFLQQNPTELEVEDFLKNKIPDYAEMVETIVAGFKSEIRGINS